MTPHSTYRLQLHGGFPFQEAEKLIPYLDRLGVAAAYLSPILLARPGSQHGYDICDHNRINPELGGEEGFRRLSGVLRAHGLGCLLDFVPNHMGADPASNPWWWDVLENGPSSPYAGFFDIDWEPIKPDLKGKVLLPLLGDQYGRVLERGELRLRFEAGSLVLGYFEHRFPVNPRMSPLVLAPDADGELPFDEAGPDGTEFLSILTSLRNLPVYMETDPARIRERQREKEVARKRMEGLAGRSPEVAAYVADRIGAFNGIPGDERSFDRLHDLLERQTYRLAFWRTAGHEINYRRFFDINGLLGVRMENPEAFQSTHGLLIRLIREGEVGGVRLDHVDGLYDPAGYLRSLRQLIGNAGEDADAAGTAPPAYVVVEKILTGAEQLRSEWPVDGTTGYEYLNDINGLFVDRDGVERLERVYRRFTGWNGTIAEEIRECKRLILDTSLGSELNVLANKLDRLSEADRNSRDFTLESLRGALREVIAAFPIYRTYGGRDGFSAEDRLAIDEALRTAASENPAMEPSIFRFVRAALLPWEEVESQEPGASIPREQRLEFAIKFQQFTSPVQAKGVEDTAFYRRAVLLSLNEVGGDPESWGLAAADFHARVTARTRAFPHGMIATATHDTKRGEDARARLNVLTALPDDWRRVLGRLSRIATALGATGAGVDRVSREDEYLLYQTLVACWPVSDDGEPASGDGALRNRILEFLIKAAREAKVRTSWINPNADYERAVERFLDGLMSGPGRDRFRAAFFPLLKTCARLGALNSLSQAALKCALPGVPDIYQGTEYWDLSLVDPDNRRPVDFAAREAALDGMAPWLDPAGGATGRREWALGLLARWPDGRIKQYVLARGLRWRREHASLFLDGDYRPLGTDRGAGSDWVAFAREREGEAVIACLRVRGEAGARSVAPGSESQDRGGETLLLPPEWEGSEWINVFTDSVFRSSAGKGARPEGLPGIDLGALGGDFPVAWLRRRAGG